MRRTDELPEGVDNSDDEEDFNERSGSDSGDLNGDSDDYGSLASEK